LRTVEFMKFIRFIGSCGWVPEVHRFGSTFDERSRFGAELRVTVNRTVNPEP